jgi:quercetin dioxygenase-like cupin family protein
MDEQQTEEARANRLRQHPTDRFSAPQHEFDLAAVAKTLGTEREAGESGHRQETLYKQGKTTISLFLFGHLTRLRPHRAKGLVSIQVLRGHLRITAEGVAHDLMTGHLLVLASGVEHDVVAQEESEMLLTVHLDGG